MGTTLNMPGCLSWMVSLSSSSCWTTTGHWFRTQVILLSINIYLRKPLVRTGACETGQMKQERDVLFKFVTAIFLTCKSVVLIQPVLIYVCTEVILPWATRRYLYNHQINNSFSQHSSTEILLLREAVNFVSLIKWGMSSFLWPLFWRLTLF